MSPMEENVAEIKDRIRAACLRAGRDPSDVRLVGVTKTVPVERIREGVRAGIVILGENYIQEARTKIEALSDLDVSWHFIGHLQSNKAKIAVELFSMIHSLDRESLAVELDRQAGRKGIRLPVLIQVNLGNEITKSGVSLEELLAFFQKIDGCENLAVRGLMALPPWFDEPERSRPHFRRLRELLGLLRENSPHPEELTELSMGMSGDFEVAVEEGATFVRIGTSLFGSRPARA